MEGAATVGSFLMENKSHSYGEFMENHGPLMIDVHKL